MKIKTILLLLLGLSPGCVGISASPDNEEDECWEESVEVGFLEVMMMGLLTKKDGQLWMFANGCSRTV